jgi:8-oxo-dGTP pyrophosphatase MutT (NUDIX family)
MAQYIIYYLDRSLIITDENSQGNKPCEIFKQPEDILNFLLEFEHDYKKNQVIFLTEKVEETWKEFIQQYKLIEAAGGIVKNNKGEIIAIFRLGKWDLPKGKREEGEEPSQTAEREIAEECGIQGHLLTGKICDTYHTYKIGEKKILKKTYWYTFTMDGNPALTPQTIENIEEAKWVKTEEFHKLLEHSYPSIRQVFNEASKIKNFL